VAGLAADAALTARDALAPLRARARRRRLRVRRADRRV